MTRKLTLLPAIALLCLAPDARAQYIVGPNSYSGGVGFQYRIGRLRIVGVVPAGTVIVGPPVVSVIERRIILQTVAPRPLYDLSGIDLDIEKPDKLYPPGSAPQRLPKPRPAEPNKPAAPLPPARLPPPQEVKPPKPPKPPIDDLWQPQPGAAGEARRLTELGIRAFRAAEYGTAQWRFRQAADSDATSARPLFLRAQAELAAGQFDAALASLHEGLKLNTDWPVSDFRPRTDLYGADHLEDWLEVRRRLGDALKRKPGDATLLFLRGYLAWFDGQREQAVEWFLKARARVAEPRFIDLFLKHAPKPAVAAS